MADFDVTATSGDRQNHRQNAANETNNSPDNTMERQHQNASICMFRKMSESQLRTGSSPEAALCPRVNCPEKIIICLDVSQEMETVSFRSRAGDKFPPLKLARRAIGMFVHSKHKIDSRHQFALVLLRETAQWALGFTHNPSDIISFLDDFNETSPTESFDIGSLFDVVNQHVTLPTVSDFRTVPPPCTIRVLFMYGRSHCLPSIEHTEAVKQLQASPHFFLDVYYIHEPPSEQNQCEAIFDQLCELDVNGLYYVYEVSRNPTKVYDYMSQLLAHPLQRPLQKDTQYFIEPPGAPGEMRG